MPNILRCNEVWSAHLLEPGQEQKRHAHSGADKIYFGVEGTGRFHIGDDERDLGPDQIVLAPADVDHGLRNESQSRLVVLVFMAPNPGSAGILPAPGVAKG